MSVQIQLDPISAAATVAVAGVPPLIDFVKSIVDSSEIDIQQLHQLSLSVAQIEQRLDKMDYAQLRRDTFRIVKLLKCSCYEAEDKLDEVLIDCSEKSGLPTKSVYNQEEAEEAKVNDKELLSELKLMWTIAPSGEQGRLKHQEVLEVLHPPNNLITLKLLGYGGVRFPHEMVNESFKNLEKVSLKNCNGCEKLPALWSLPILKTLCIRGMDEIEQLNSESFLESGIRIGRRLPSLETLKVEEMSNLRSCDATTFPRLNQLTIKECPMLEEIQELQMLDSQCRLTIKECPLLIEWMDNQQPGWQKEVQDDGSLIYQKIEQA